MCEKIPSRDLIIRLNCGIAVQVQRNIGLEIAEQDLRRMASIRRIDVRTSRAAKSRKERGISGVHISVMGIICVQYKVGDIRPAVRITYTLIISLHVDDSAVSIGIGHQR